VSPLFPEFVVCSFVNLKYGGVLMQIMRDGMVIYVDGCTDYLVQICCNAIFKFDCILIKFCRNQAGTSTEDRLVLPFDEIAELAPGNSTERDLEVEFKHQLTPLKLAIVMNGKTYPVKLAPEVGALLRPLQMTRIEFMTAQSRISGMHESSRRCALILMCSIHDTCINMLRVYIKIIHILDVPCIIAMQYYIQV